MAIEIVMLPVDADIPWLVDRLNGAQAPRVLLLAPNRLPYMQGRGPWRRVAHHARHLGLQLAVVTRDPRLTRWIQEAGIPCFPHREAAESQPWPRLLGFRPLRTPRGREAFLVWKTSLPHPHALGPQAQALAVALAVLAWAGLALLLLPSARVELPLRATPVELRIPVRLLPPSQRAAEGQGDTLPIEARCTRLESRFTVPATGVVHVPVTPARGLLLFQNLTDRALNIPPGLRVRSEHGLVFEVTRGGTLPPGPDGVLLLPARALQSGSQGNLPPRQRWYVPADWEMQVVVRNPAAMTGGREVALPTVTEADVVSAREANRPMRAARARVALQARLQPDDVLLEAPAQTRLLEQRVIPNPGEPASSAQVFLQERWCFWVVSGDALRALARARLTAALPRGHRGLETTLAARLEEVSGDTDLRGVVWARWLTVPALEKSALAHHLTLKPVAQVQAFWSRHPAAAGPARIHLSPAWWPWIPLRLQIQLEPVP